MLNVVVSREVFYIRAIGKVFNTNPMNRSIAIKRRKQVEASRSSHWALLT